MALYITKILQMYTNSYKTWFTRQFYLRARKSDFAWLKPIARSFWVFAYVMQIEVAHALQTMLSLDKLYG